MNAFDLFVFKLTLLSFCGLLCWVAFTDYTRYVIPNSICLAIVALFPAFVLASPVPVDWPGHVSVGAAILGLGFVFYIFDLTGGGDVKLLAATSLWAGQELILEYLLVVALGGGLMSLIALAKLRVFRFGSAGGPSFGVRLSAAMKTHVAYGVAIAAGGLFLAGRLVGV